MSINLLPWRETALRKKQHWLMRQLLIFCIIFFGLAIIAKFFLVYQTHRITNNTNAVRSTIQQLILPDPQKNNARLLDRLKTLFPQKNAATENNQAMLDILSTIAVNLPSSIMLTQLTMTKKEIILNGISNQLSDIHQYDFALQKINWKHITLSDIHNDSQHQAQIDFSIRMHP